MARSLVTQSLHYFARPHVGPPPGSVGGPAAWRGSDLSAADWRVDLRPAEADALRAAVDASAGVPLAAMTAADFPLGPLAERVAGWRARVARGPGLVVIRGAPAGDWSQAEAERFFWGLGQHLGIPGAQNPRGDLLGHVRDEGYDDQTAVRAYRTRTRINFHCDNADLVGLFCLRQGARGGSSRVASSVAVHDALLAERPDLAAALYRPFWLDTKAEGGLRCFPIEPCRFDGQRLRTFYHADYFRSVERHPDAPRITPRQREALDRYDALAEEMALSMDLLPGDIQLISNHTIVHGRAAFEDAGDQRRHLLRLWLSLPGDEGGGGARGPWLRLAGRLGWQRLRQR